MEHQHTPTWFMNVFEWCFSTTPRGKRINVSARVIEWPLGHRFVLWLTLFDAFEITGSDSIAIPILCQKVRLTLQNGSSRLPGRTPDSKGSG